MFCIDPVWTLGCDASVLAQAWPDLYDCLTLGLRLSDQSLVTRYDKTHGLHMQCIHKRLSTPPCISLFSFSFSSVQFQFSSVQFSAVSVQFSSVSVQFQFSFSLVQFPRWFQEKSDTISHLRIAVQSTSEHRIAVQSASEHRIAVQSASCVHISHSH